MARKRYSDEDALKLLREIDVHLHDGLDVVGACRKAGISDKTYYYWRKKFGGLGRPQLSEMKALKKENERLKKIVCGPPTGQADLEREPRLFKAEGLTVDGLRQAVIHTRQRCCQTNENSHQLASAA